MGQSSILADLRADR